MILSPTQWALMRVTAAFGAVARHYGVLPKRLAKLYAASDLKTLEEAGLLERVKIRQADGEESKGWRLSEAGQRLLPRCAGQAEAELDWVHRRLLEDFHHYACLSRHRGIVPEKVAREYDAGMVEDLFAWGYLLRVRVAGEVKAKGWVVSRKGLIALRQIQAGPDDAPADGPLPGDTVRPALPADC